MIIPIYSTERGNVPAMMRTLQRKSANLFQQDIVSPKGCYVYAIYVDGVLRYIGKGTNSRMYAHMREVRQRLTRKFNLKNVSPIFQQKLTEAVVKGAVVEEIVIAENLTSKQAYELEHRHMEEMVHDGKRGQLWNVVPPSIYTPQEYEAFVKKLLENSRSKNNLARYFARMQLARLASHNNNARTPERRPDLCHSLAEPSRSIRAISDACSLVVTVRSGDGTAAEVRPPSPETY